MSRADPVRLAAAIALIGAGLLIAWWVADPALRYAGSITAVAVGLGFLRQAFRAE